MLVERDGETLIDFDEDVLSWSTNVDTPITEVSLEGPYRQYEHTGWWHLRVDALRRATK